MCVHVNIPPAMSKTRIPASVQSVNFNVPTPPLKNKNAFSYSDFPIPLRKMVLPIPHDHTGRRAKLLRHPRGEQVGHGRSREHTLGRDLTRPLTPEECLFL